MPENLGSKRWDQETEKWDQYYASLQLMGETEETRSFGQELLDKSAAFLPEGSQILEAGCGGGWQSLALARSGKYQISLLDFSREALKYAQKVFQQAHLEVETIFDNFISPGKPEFDLVFNAGVFEHYTFEEQVELLRGMASRSKKYVMVVVPNRLCYWYWIWRVNASSHGLWSFGKEVPFFDLSKLFEAAGLHFVGQAFMAAEWTESFVKSIPGLDDNLRQIILDIHQSPVIDPYQKSYLVAGLGSVSDELPTQIPGWESSLAPEDFNSAVLQSIIADALSSKVFSEAQYVQSLAQVHHNVQVKNEELAALQSDLGQKDAELNLRADELGQAQYRAGLLQYEIDEIKRSRMWKVVQFAWRTRQRLIPTGSGRARFVRASTARLKWLLRITGISSLAKATRSSLDHRSKGRKTTGKKRPGEEIGFLTSYLNKKMDYTSWLADAQNAHLDDVEKINALIHQKPYRGIVVYPHAVHWEPVQRPQQILIELGRRGYLCFFCEAQLPELELEEKFENVYVISGEKYLLYPLQNFQVLTLCTWMYQMPFIEFLPHRYLWYDLIDKLEIFSLFDADMQKMHAEIVKTADLVTYSGLKLIEFVAERKDARYLPNGVRIEDFTKATKGISDPKIAEILAKGKPVIGYYGALAEWVDLSLVRALAEVHAEWEFVLIGKAWVNISKLENLPNLHYFGPVPYTELPGYAIQFDVGIIPFAVNELTDCVSPIKLFEYCALGLPIITTPFYEVKQYQESFIKFANTVEEFSTAIAGCLDEKVKAAAKTEGLSFAQKNQWSTRIEKVEETIFQSWDGLRCLANYTPYHHLAVMAETFYHYDGRGFYAGGAERYLIDLENFFSKMNIKLVVYQYGTFPWMRKYQDVDVVSLAPKGHYLKDLTMEAVNNFNRNFFIANLKKSLINIYSPFYDNWPLALHPCIGVSHGISWDHYLSHYENGIRFWDANRGMIESSKTCDLLVSVDTNTANWFQTIDYETGQKIQYVPNYVDLEQFHPRQDYLAPREKVIILYPRRLYRARGLYLLLAVVDDILEAYPQVEFHFVGRGFEEDTRHVVKKQQKWGARLQWYALAPEEMPQAYQNADISLIPTLYSEGTSLACLEAMACGNAVIATRIGGLTNLVINEHNGVLIEPQAAALKAAIVSLLDDPDKLARLKQNGLEVAGAFSKRAWEQKWGKIIEDMLVENQPASPYEYSKTRLVDVYCDDPRNPAYLNMLLAQLLQNNLLIYLRVKGNPSALIQSSYQRLQFLDWDEAIDAKPDLVIADASSARQLEQVDVILTGDLEQDVPSILSDL